ncbi:MAG TPA: DUF433 domain-containing protein [Fimbriimonas sp.]|nr:DUF433 domain-containing protein [Fimbriimonas sp.]
MNIPPELEGILVSTPGVLSGAVRFVGTRVLVQALFDTIICGESVEYFLKDFPEVSREQAMAVLTWEQNKVRESLGLEFAKS